MCEKIFIISQVLPDDALKIMKWILPKKNDVISLPLMTVSSSSKKINNTLLLTQFSMSNVIKKGFNFLWHCILIPMALVFG